MTSVTLAAELSTVCQIKNTVNTSTDKNSNSSAVTVRSNAYQPQTKGGACPIRPGQLPYTLQKLRRNAGPLAAAALPSAPPVAPILDFWQCCAQGENRSWMNTQTSEKSFTSSGQGEANMNRAMVVEREVCSVQHRTVLACVVPSHR